MVSGNRNTRNSRFTRSVLSSSVTILAGCFLPGSSPVRGSGKYAWYPSDCPPFSRADNCPHSGTCFWMEGQCGIGLFQLCPGPAGASSQGHHSPVSTTASSLCGLLAWTSLDTSSGTGCFNSSHPCEGPEP